MDTEEDPPGDRQVMERLVMDRSWTASSEEVIPAFLAEASRGVEFPRLFPDAHSLYTYCGGGRVDCFGILNLYGSSLFTFLPGDSIARSRL